MVLQASIRVCEALADLREEWSQWNEWESSRIYHCQTHLPQLQIDLTQCNNGRERAILLELKQIATSDEWANLPVILANLDEQMRRARHVQATEAQPQTRQGAEVQQSIAAIKTMLAAYHFAEAEALYTQIKAAVPGFAYRMLLHRYQDEHVRTMIAQMQTLLTAYSFTEAEQLYHQIAYLYPQAEYQAKKTAAEQRQQNEIAQRLETLLAQEQNEIAQRLEMLLAQEQFDAAEQTFGRVQDSFPLARYRALRERYWQLYMAAQKWRILQDELRPRLADYRFVEADAFALANPYMNLSDYTNFKAQFVRSYFNEVYQLSLNDEQSIAIGTPAHSLLVTARAGAGKTRVITGKAAYVIAHEGITLAQILLLAFNEEAEIEMRCRMRKLLGLRHFDNARTFHSLAYALIQPGDKLLRENKGRGSREEIVQNVFTEAWEDFSFAHLVLTFCVSDLAEKSGWSDGLKEDQYYEVKRKLPLFSLNGESVKSRGEKYIADFIYEHNISYVYEQMHDWNGRSYKPDFTILDKGLVQPVIIEYWGIDENDPTAATPSNWERTAQDYREEMVKKRAYWQNRQIQLIEMAPPDQEHGREHFEEILKARLEAAGIICGKCSAAMLKAKVPIEKSDNLTKLFLDFIQRAKQQNQKPIEIDLSEAIGEDETRDGIFRQLAMRIYCAYEAEKTELKRIDFDDLMAQAITKINDTQGDCCIELNGQSVKLNQIRWLLVDEFQDLSTMFYQLLESLRLYNPALNLFCVGDDWQAINSFAGADLYYFHQFTHLFPDAIQLNLLTNQRSLGAIVQKANAFMTGMGEPALARADKIGGALFINHIDNVPFATTIEPTSGQTSHEDQRFLFDDRKSGRSLLLARTLKRCWQIITDASHKNKFITVLSRKNKIYGKDLKQFSEKLLTLCGLAYTEQIEVSTIHNFKGREADIVILVEVTTGLFPLIHKDNRLFAEFSRNGENVDELARAEEERLFYVALTRAREKLWILTEVKRKSKFLEQLEQTV